MTSKLDRIQENASKYIVKNCPCYIDMPLYHHDKVCRLGDRVRPNHKELYVYCADCTDCVIKQIVESCKNKDYFVKRFPNAQFSSGVQNSELAFDILQLLDIEEVRE
jgi:hypothetical protein